MTLSEAKSIIRDDAATPITWLKATTVLTAPESFCTPSSFEDLLQCLQRGEPSASSAAITLYYRTGRPKPTDVTQFDHDVNSWKKYLKDKGFFTL